jgi:microcystin-dependent protein
MSTITTIQSSDLITNSRTDINTNFSNLNVDKIETSVLDTDTSLAANSDSKVATQKAVKTYIDTGGNPSGFTGVVSPYAGSSAPTGWLLCNGAAVSRATYAALFAVCSTTFGIGDGSTTFNLPNLQNRIPVGVGSATKVATFASRSSDVITVTGLTNAANNEFQTGQAIVYHTSGSVITGLTNDTTYYLVRTGNLTFSLATTLANAQNATVISLSSDGTGTQTFTQTFTTRTLGDYGGEENHAMSSTELLAHTHDINFGTANSGAAHSTSGAVQSNAYLTSSTGGNTSMNIMQPYCVLNYIIKT